MRNLEESREWLNIWPSFADIAICAMIVFLIYSLYLISLMPKQIRIGELTENKEVFFKSGDATLPDSFKPILNKLYAQILERPEWSDPSWVIVVNGHTDNVPMKGGRYRSNWELSAARALSVVNYLTEYKNVPPQRIRAIGYGEYKPKVSNNKPPIGTPANRRIEVILFKSDGRI